MGEIELRGPQALALLNYITSNDMLRAQGLSAQYTRPDVP